MDWRSAGPPLSPPAEEDDDEDEDDGAEAEAEAAARAAAATGAEEEAARGAGGRRAAERARPPSMRPTGTSDRAAAVRPARADCGVTPSLIAGVKGPPLGGV